MVLNIFHCFDVRPKATFSCISHPVQQVQTHELCLPYLQFLLNCTVKSELYYYCMGDKFPWPQIRHRFVVHIILNRKLERKPQQLAPVTDDSILWFIEACIQARLL